MARADPAAFIRSLLCGMPAERRRDSLVAVVSNAYLDESGVGLDTGHFILGGYIGPEEMWGRLSTEWGALLTEHGISDVHMVRFERNKEPKYAHIPAGTARKKALGQYVETIVRHHPIQVSTHIIVKDWEVAVKDKLPGWVDPVWEDPYMIAASAMTSQLLRLHEHLKLDLGVVVPIFDYHQKYRDKIRTAILTGLRPFIVREHPELAKRLGEPVFPDVGNRNQYLPLQAADILAWHEHRALTHRDGKNRRAYRDLKKASKRKPILRITRGILERYVQHWPKVRPPGL